MYVSRGLQQERAGSEHRELVYIYMPKAGSKRRILVG